MKKRSGIIIGAVLLLALLCAIIPMGAVADVDPPATITVGQITNGSIVVSYPGTESVAPVENVYTVPAGADVTITAVPATGYEVDTQTLDGEDYDGNSFSAESEHDYAYAVTFKLKTYSITCEAATNGDVSSTSATVTHGGNTTVTMTPDAGYELGSLKIKKGEGSYETINANILYVSGVYTYSLTGITDNVSVQASFKLKSYHLYGSVVYGSNSNITGSVSPIQSTVTHGGTASFKIEPAEGCIIDTVTVGNSNVNLKDSVDSDGILELEDITKDTTVYVKFKAKTYTVSCSVTTNINYANTGSLSAPSTVDHFDEFPVVIQPAEGYEIASFTVNGVDKLADVENGMYYVDSADGNYEFKAAFKLKEYDITLTTDNHGTLTGAESAKHGESKDYTITPNEYYLIDTVTVAYAKGGTKDVTSDLAETEEGSGVYTFTVSNIKDDITVTAEFKLEEYEVSVSVAENADEHIGGELEADKENVERYGSVEFTMTPDTGCEVDTLTVNGVDCTAGISNNKYTYENALGAVTAQVSYRLKTYNISASVTENEDTHIGGTAVSNVSTAQHFSNVSFTITPKTGCEVESVYVNGAGKNLASKISDGVLEIESISGNVELNVTFALKEYTMSGAVTTDSDPNVKGTVVPDSDTALHFSDMTFTVEPGVGCEVAKLTVGDDTTDRKDEIVNDKFTVSDISDNVVVIVTFKLKSYDVSSEIVPDEDTNVTGTVTPNKVKADHFSSIEYTIEPGVGCEVAKLTVGDSQVDRKDEISNGKFTVSDISDDVNITVTFKLKEYTVQGLVTEDEDELVSGTISADKETVEHFSSVTYTISPAQGCEIAKVTVGSDTTDRKSEMVGDKFTVSNVDGDVTVTVTFGLIGYRMTGVVSENEDTHITGTIVPDKQVALHFSTVVYTINPGVGCEVEKLTIGNSDVDVKDSIVDGQFTIENISSDITVTVTFKLKTYSMTGSVEENEDTHITGTVVPDRKTAEHFSTVTYTITPGEGCEIAKLTVGDDTTDRKSEVKNGKFTIIEVDGNTDVHVTFKLKEYSITGAVTENEDELITGTVVPNVATAEHYSNVSFVITPGEGCEIDKVTVNGGETDVKEQMVGDTLSINSIGGDITVTATFKLIEYQMTGAVTPDEDAHVTGTVTPDSEYVCHFKDAVFTVTPGVGCEVAKLTVGSDPTDRKDEIVNGKFTVEGITGEETVTATFKLKSYSIVGTVTPDEDEKITGTVVPDRKTAEHYSSVTYTITPAEGCEVAKLTVNDDTTDRKDEIVNGKFTLIDISGELDVKVTFKLIEYNMTGSVSPNENEHIIGTVVPDREIAEHFSSVVYTITPGEGCEIVKLTVGTDPTDRKDEIEDGEFTVSDISGDVNVTATFKLKEYSISKELLSEITTGSIELSPDSATANHFDAIDVILTPSEGYGIDSFTVNGVECKEQVEAGVYTHECVSENTAFAVSYKPLEYKMTTYSDSHGTITQSFTAKHFDRVEITVTPNEGYEVQTFTVDGKATKLVDGRYVIESVDAPHTFGITYKLKKYNIVTTAGNNGTITDSKIVTHFSNLTIIVQPDGGYEVDTFLVDGEPAVLDHNKYTFTSISGDHSVEVTFKKRLYRITTNSETVTNGTITAGKTVSYQDPVVITVAPNEGYIVDKFLVDGEEAELTNLTYTFATVDDNHTVSVSFKKIQFTIVAAVSANGTVDPMRTNVNYGDDQLITIVPNLGYSVSKFEVDGATAYLIEGKYFIFRNVKEDHTLTVEFDIMRYTISASAGANGTISESGTVTANYGETKSYTITPNDGYAIDSLKVDGVETEVPSNGVYTFSNISSDHSISVTFKKLVYSIDSSAGQYGTITPLGEKIVNYGESVTYTIIPNDGYEIDKLTVDGRNVSAMDMTYTFSSVMSDHTITVTFKRISGKEYQLATEIISGHEYVIVSGGYALTNNGGKLTETTVYESSDKSYIIAPESGNVMWMLSDTVGNRDTTNNLYVSTGAFTISNGDYLFVSGSSSLIDVTSARITQTPTNDKILGYASYEWNYDFTSKLLSQKGLGTTLCAYYNNLTGFSTISTSLSSVTDVTVRIYDTGKIADHVHVAVSDTAEPASCTQAGHTGGSHCGICGVQMEERTIIQPLGHAWDEGVVTKEPTYTTYGSALFTCTRCGAVKVAQVDKLHNYGDPIYTWSSDKSTCTAIRICECGAYETEVAHSTSVVTLEPKDGKDGVRTYTAEFQNSAFIPQSIAETISGHVHTFTNYVYNNDAKPGVDGTETGTCSCGEKNTRTKAGTALDSSVKVTLASFTVKLGNQVINSKNDEYPFIIYNDITYLPLTYYGCRALGLGSDWNADTGLVITQTGEVLTYQPTARVSSNTGTLTAKIATGKITLAGTAIDNTKEEYPFLIFRDVTYLPMTWKNMNDLLGCSYGFDSATGLSVGVAKNPNEAKVTVVSFPVKLGNQTINSANEQYPFIMYNDITYLPLTYAGCGALGLTSNWTEKTGLSITKSGRVTVYVSAPNTVPNTGEQIAQKATGRINISGVEIDNTKEEYPFLIFRNVTYMPMTWHNMADILGCDYTYSDATGLSIGIAK